MTEAAIETSENISDAIRPLTEDELDQTAGGYLSLIASVATLAGVAYFSGNYIGTKLP